MKKGIFNVLKIAIPLALGIFAIQYELKQLTESEKVQLFDSIKSANPLFLILSGLTGFVSHISRSIRWKYTLEPLGYHPRLKNSFNSIMLSYFVNIFIPRGGELTRSAVLFKTEKIPPSKSFGTVVTERIADLFCLSLIVGIVLLLEGKILSSILSEKLGSSKPGFGLLFGFLFFIAMALAGNYLLNKWKDKRFFKKLHQIKEGLLHGALSIFKMKNSWAYIGHSLFIWICYAFMHYLCFLSIPELASAGIGPILASFVVGGITLIILSGGLGVYPTAIKDTLVMFGFLPIPSYALGWVIWITQTLMIILGGIYSGISFMFFSSKKDEVH
jgi:uncharacterized protein (TIRG00374 family)